MKLIIGLGNPGEQYLKTRHNLGFVALDEYAKKHLGPEIIWEIDKKFKSEILKLSQDLWLVKPLTFMNNSGQAVRQLVDYFKVPLADLIIVYDELDLPLGKIKVRSDGAAAGHHGVESIIKALGDDKFIRVRLGIGEQHIDAEKFVLDTFRSDEKVSVKHMLKQAIHLLDILIEDGLEKAQSQFH